MFVTFGHGTESYGLTSWAAKKLLEPFRSKGFRLDDAIDMYVVGRMSGYWHELNTYLELYEGLGVIHGHPKGPRTSLRRGVDVEK